MLNSFFLDPQRIEHISVTLKYLSVRGWFYLGRFWKLRRWDSSWILGDMWSLGSSCACPYFLATRLWAALLCQRLPTVLGKHLWNGEQKNPSSLELFMSGILVTEHKITTMWWPPQAKSHSCSDLISHQVCALLCISPACILFVWYFLF